MSLEQSLFDSKQTIDHAIGDLSSVDKEVAREDAMLAIDTLMAYLEAQKAQLESGKALEAGNLEMFNTFAERSAHSYQKAGFHAGALAQALVGPLKAKYEAAAEKYHEIDNRFAARVEDFRVKTGEAGASALESVSTRVSLLSSKLLGLADHIRVEARKVVQDVKDGVTTTKAVSQNWFTRFKDDLGEKAHEIKEHAAAIKARAEQKYDGVVMIGKAVAATAQNLVGDPLLKAAGKVGDFIVATGHEVTSEFRLNHEALKSQNTHHRRAP